MWRLSVVSILAMAGIFLGGSGGASAHPDPLEHGKTHAPVGLGMQVNSPPELADFHPGVQWGDTGKLDFQTAQLVYGGTGCTPASYAPVADKIRGNIALVDDRVSADGKDNCPTYTFAQKVQSAERAGAIGLVHIPAEGKEPRGNATAVYAGIPALELARTPQLLATRDAVIAGTAVEATLTPEPKLESMGNLPCQNGMAGPFECDGIDLMSFTAAEEFNGAGQSDIWGWTDPQTGDEYVLMGKTNGTAIFRVTDPVNPLYLGELPNRALLQRVWHDMKVYENHAFIVSESEPHGMTVFDLTRLRGVNEPRVWNEDAFYRLHSAAHNIAINQETGFAYIVGGNQGLVVPDHCMSGLHMVDISTPKSPKFAGCYLEEGGPGTLARTIGPEAEQLSPAAYVHDTECVIYDGPDRAHAGREICFNSAETKVVIADVTNKQAPVTLGFTAYEEISYAHQGALTPDHRFLLVNDELDETEYGTNTRTIVMDVSDLENPKVHFEHMHPVASIDHNNYVHDGLVYQSNYTSGLRVLDVGAIDDPSNPRLEPVAFFDTYPLHTDPTFNGTWSNYPFFKSGTIAVSGIDEGLFLLRRSGASAPAAAAPPPAAEPPADSGATGGGGGQPADGATPRQGAAERPSEANNQRRAETAPRTRSVRPGRRALKLRIGRAIRMDRRGRARLAVRCPRAAKRRCSGTIRLLKGKRAVGRRRFSIRSGERKVLAIRVQPAARQRRSYNVRARGRDAERRLVSARKRVRLARN